MSTAGVTRESVEAAISAVLDPCSIAMRRPMSLVTMGLIEEIAIDGGDVRVSLVLTDPMCFVQADLVRAVDEAVRAVDGVDTVNVRIDRDVLWTPDRIHDDAPAPARLPSKPARLAHAASRQD